MIVDFKQVTYVTIFWNLQYVMVDSSWYLFCCCIAVLCFYVFGIDPNNNWITLSQHFDRVFEFPKKFKCLLFYVIYKTHIEGALIAKKKIS